MTAQPDYFANHQRARQFPFTLKGNYNPARDVEKVKLTGINGGAGSKASLSFTGTEGGLLSISGKISGQSLR